MPMLTTLRIGCPCGRVHSPERTRSAKAAHAVEHLVDVGDDVAAVDDERASRGMRSATCSTGAVLGDVDALAANIASTPLATPARLGQLDEQRDRLVGDAVLRVVEVQAGGFGGQPRPRSGSSAKRSRRCAPRSRRDGQRAPRTPGDCGSRTSSSSWRLLSVDGAECRRTEQIVAAGAAARRIVARWSARSTATPSSESRRPSAARAIAKRSSATSSASSS